MLARSLKTHFQKQALGGEHNGVILMASPCFAHVFESSFGLISVSQNLSACVMNLNRPDIKGLRWCEPPAFSISG